MLQAAVAAIAAGVILTSGGAEASSITDPAQVVPTPGLSGAQVTLRVTALDYLIAASDAGDPVAMNSLGVLYCMGTQVRQDYATALLWFQKAIDAGSADAMSNLATMYLRGMGVPRDFDNAFRWFERSAVRGNAIAMYVAAVMADEGLGTPRDAKRAIALYRQAAESGSVAAMVRMSDEHSRSGGTQRLVEAYAWLLVAAQSTVPDELGIVVLARIERVRARLPSAQRDEARVLAESRLARLRTPADSARWTAGMLDSAQGW